MGKPIVAVGTTSSQKLDYLNEVVSQIGLNVELKPVEADSDVSSQPLTEEETKRGSINRARNALRKVPLAECGLGVEVGYQKDTRGNYEMFCYASIVDRNSLVLFGKSHVFPLPHFHQDKLKNNAQLGDHVRDYLKKDNHPLIQFIGEMIRGRKPFIVEAVRSVLLLYFKREEFGEI